MLLAASDSKRDDPRHSRPGRGASALVLGAALALVGAARAQSTDSVDVEYFEVHVRPLLALHCTGCHGGDQPKGGLDLSTTRALRAGMRDLELVHAPQGVDGAPGGLLLEAIGYEDPLLAMPPDGKLPDEALAVFLEWARRGAPLPPESRDSAEAHGSRAAVFDLEGRRAAHWAWQPLLDVAPPDVASADPLADPIDQFLAAAVAASGLDLAPPAPRATWLRRATYTLTGLPPTPAELEAFEVDRAPGADERVVDRLLVSPHYAERFARHWLDLVRYAETRGYEYDFPIPNAWQYRDYVIRALDADVPYDRFVTEHSAGDLLAEDPRYGPRLDPTGRFDESVLGTGWWWLNDEVHAPLDTLADEAERVANQVDTLSKTFLGLTVACARCHDHKFDAVSTEDYYALAGFARSMAYRQVPFEARSINADVGRELAEHAVEQDHATRAAIADFVRGLGGELAALAQDDTRDPAVGPPAAPRPEDLALAPWMDVVLADFEAPDFTTGLLGPWTAEGEAFRDRPARTEDLKPEHQVYGQRGAGFLASHAGHAGEGGPTGNDGPRGRLTSAPFTLERDWLHVLLCGGDDGSTALGVLVDGEVVASASGARDVVLQRRRLDVRRWRGREARLVVIDGASGEWGHIALDHVVASDDAELAALDRGYYRDSWRHWLGEALEATGNDRPRVLRRVALARLIDRSAARGPGSPLFWLRGHEDTLTVVSDPTQAARALGAALIDYRLPGTRWFQDGETFGPGPREAGAVLLGRPSTEDPALEGRWRAPRVVTATCAAADPFWRGQSLTPEAEVHGGVAKHVQSGRTLVTPTVQIEGGHVQYLVRGRGTVFAVCDGHRTIHGPLWDETVMPFDTEGEWRYVHHDLTRLVGAHARFEFTVEDDGGAYGLELAAIFDRDEAEPPLLPLPGDWLARRLEELELDSDGGARREDLVRSAFADAATFLESGAVPGSALDDSERRGLLQAIDELLADAYAVGFETGLVAPLERRLAEPRVSVPELAERAARMSAIAPATLELEGRDYEVLRRGEARSPGALAPRRDLTALRGDDVALAMPGSGSGRLALARAWTQAEQPLLARVYVNRLWHHTFGRGLVPTVDDFGVTGAVPTDPALLDRLARDFVADGWSTKRLLRRLVLSATFRRASAPPAGASDVDPGNRLWSHMPVQRLAAEAVRDALLAARCLGRAR